MIDLEKKHKILATILMIIALALISILALDLFSSVTPKLKYPPAAFYGPSPVEFPDQKITFYQSELQEISWAPDNQHMVGFIHVLSGSKLSVYAYTDLPETSEIYIWDSVENYYQLVSGGGFRDGKLKPRWNPTNEMIVYSCSYCDDFGESDMGIIDLETNEITSLIGSFHYGFWFPDGERILTSEFRIIDLESNILQSFSNLIGDYENIKLINLSQDGNKILFYVVDLSKDYETRFTTYIYTINTEEVLELINKIAYQADWSHDSSLLTIFYTTTEPQDYLVTINQNNNCITDSFSFPIEMGYKAKLDRHRISIAWSHDGKKLALSGELRGYGRGIFLIDTDSDLIQDWLSSGTCGN